MSTSGENREKRIVGHRSEEMMGGGVEPWTPGSREEIRAMPALPEYPAEIAEERDEGRAGEDGSRGNAWEMAVAGATGPPGAEEGDLPPGREPVAEMRLSPVQQLTREHPEAVAGLLHTMLGERNEEWKAAVVLVTLGRRISGELMRYLSDAENQQLIQRATDLDYVDAGERRQIVEEFEQRLVDGEYSIRGGMNFARAALQYAVGPQRAQQVLERISSLRSSGFYMLKNATPVQIAPFISHEHPQTIALILSQLEPVQAAGIVGQLPKRMQADVAYRIATMENITPNVIKEIEESLESSLRDVLGSELEVGGPKAVADILNLTGSSVEKNVLDQIDAQDPEVAEVVRNLMFVFEDIAKLTDREIQTLMREVDQKELVIALKAASKGLMDKVLGNMSERVRSFITEEMEYLGPMRLSEVEEVQLRIVQQVRQLEEQGKVTIVRGDSDDAFV